jgi:hypothetical protein
MRKLLLAAVPVVALIAAASFTHGARHHTNQATQLVADCTNGTCVVSEPKDPTMPAPGRSRP